MIIIVPIIAIKAVVTTIASIFSIIYRPHCLVPPIGIEPTSQPLQGHANPSQLQWHSTFNLMTCVCYYFFQISIHLVMDPVTGVAYQLHHL